MIGNDWDNKLSSVYQSDEYKLFINKIHIEYNRKIIYPSNEYIYLALKLTSYKNTRVVIIGQDPYHGEGEAHGLSFSVRRGVKIPPSLKNIFKELKADLNIDINQCGDLTKWAKAGVLLLNAILTVEKDSPASHRNLGWEKITDHIISVINDKEEPVVFVLWGKYAQSKKELITNSKHLVLIAPHPSPFSANKGFFGSKPFSKINNFLQKNNLPIIDWRL